MGCKQAIAVQPEGSMASNQTDTQTGKMEMIEGKKSRNKEGPGWEEDLMNSTNEDPEVKFTNKYITDPDSPLG